MRVLYGTVRHCTVSAQTGRTCSSPHPLPLFRSKNKTASAQRSSSLHNLRRQPGSAYSTRSIRKSLQSSLIPMTPRGRCRGQVQYVHLGMKLGCTVPPQVPQHIVQYCTVHTALTLVQRACPAGTCSPGGPARRGRQCCRVGRGGQRRGTPGACQPRTCNNGRGGEGEGQITRGS